MRDVTLSLEDGVNAFPVQLGFVLVPFAHAASGESLSVILQVTSARPDLSVPLASKAT